MVMSVFAEIINGFECFCKCNILFSRFWVKNNSVVFWYLGMYVTKGSPDKSWQCWAEGLLDVLTPLSDCRHETVEKIMERRIFGGFVYVLDGFPQHVFVLRVFMCMTNITLFCLYFASLRLPRRGLPRPILTTTGYHACVYIPVTTPELSRSTNTRTSGYHTRY